MTSVRAEPYLAHRPLSRCQLERAPRPARLGGTPSGWGARRLAGRLFVLRSCSVAAAAVELAAAPVRTAVSAAPEPAIDMPGSVILLVVLVELVLCASATAADPARQRETAASRKFAFMLFPLRVVAASRL